MGIITLDFETFYSQDYSLRKMTQADYILDPRFEIIICAIKENDKPSYTYVGIDEVRARLNQIDWKRNAFLSHNATFDAGILAWRLGIQPAMYLDTLSMSKALLSGSVSLENVAASLKIGVKGKEVHDFKGWTLAHFLQDPQAMAKYRSYCENDADLCYKIYNTLMKAFPVSELAVIDMTVRMFCEPQVKLDANILATHLGEVRARKAQTMAKVSHVGPEVFRSSDKFANLLISYGVSPPRKISPTTGEEIWALAKGDREFKELCSDPDQTEEVQALLAARVDAKSTLEESRTERMLALAQKDWPEGRGTGWAPVPLRYYGAHTGRFSGSDKQNWQNFRRDSKIKDAIKAPDGWRIVHRDSSQIEARMCAWLAGCDNLMRAFREGRDIYSEFASEVYQRRVTRDHKLERFVGKTSILGLGYGMGAARFQHTLFIGSGGLSVKVEPNEAEHVVNLYRMRYPEIPQLWAVSDQFARSLMQLSTVSRPKIKQCVRAGAEVIWLPNNMPINYRNIRKDNSVSRAGEMVYDDSYGVTRKLFGGKVVENLCQALARIVITDIMIRVKNQFDWTPFLTTHDSVDYCVPDHTAGDMDKILRDEFAKEPAWAKGLPLASEGGWGVSLRDAENAINQ